MSVTSRQILSGGAPLPDRFPAVDQVDATQLWPGGAPASWDRLVTAPTTPRWAKVIALVASVAAGVATLTSSAVAAGAAATFGVLGEVLAVGGHVTSLAPGPFGLIGRLVGAGALAAALGRLLWRWSRWGAAPIGERR